MSGEIVQFCHPSINRLNLLRVQDYRANQMLRARASHPQIEDKTFWLKLAERLELIKWDIHRETLDNTSDRQEKK